MAWCWTERWPRTGVTPAPRASSAILVEVPGAVLNPSLELEAGLVTARLRRPSWMCSSACSRAATQGGPGGSSCRAIRPTRQERRPGRRRRARSGWAAAPGAEPGRPPQCGWKRPSTVTPLWWSTVHLQHRDSAPPGWRRASRTACRARRTPPCSSRSRGRGGSRPSQSRSTLGRLLGEQHGLALGPDHDGRRKGEVGAAGQIGEHGQRLAERVLDRVGPAEVAVHGGVGPEHVVVRRQGGCNPGPRRPAPMARTAPRSPPTSGLGEDQRRCPCRQSALPRGTCRRAGLRFRGRPVTGRGGDEGPDLHRTPAGRASYDQQLRMAQAAEVAGFDAFFRSDHFLTMGGDGLPRPQRRLGYYAGVGSHGRPIGSGSGHSSPAPPSGSRVCSPSRWRRSTP